MDERTQKMFDRISKKDLNSLNEPDKVFLKARRSYLSIEQKKKFETIIKPKTK